MPINNYNIELAIKYADMIDSATDKQALELIAKEINVNLSSNSSIVYWRDWLLEIYHSKLTRLNMKDIPIDKTLNTEGQKWAKKEGVI